jgi:hypothetical protein
MKCPFLPAAISSEVFGFVLCFMDRSVPHHTGVPAIYFVKLKNKSWPINSPFDIDLLQGELQWIWSLAHY